MGRDILADVAAKLICGNPRFASILNPLDVPVVTVTPKGVKIFVPEESPYGVDVAREAEIHQPLERKPLIRIESLPLERLEESQEEQRLSA